MNTKGQQILKEECNLGKYCSAGWKRRGSNLFSRFPILYIVLRSNTEEPLLIVNLIKNSIALSLIKIIKNSAKKVSLAGMGANSEWVLNGPYLDKTLIRNKLVYDLARELNGWAPDTRFVELFVDGKYQGVYLAVEPVTNGESRLRLCGIWSVVGRNCICGKQRQDRYGRLKK